MFEGSIVFWLFTWLVGAPMLALVIDYLRTPGRDAMSMQRSDAPNATYGRT